MSHSTPRTMANMLFKSLSGDEQREINSQKICKYCKTVTDHLISNCPKLAKKEERRLEREAYQARRKEEKARLEKEKFEFYLKSVKAKFGSNWYKKVEDTEYDCGEAYELRMEDEWREEQEYWREQQEEEEYRKKYNKLNADVEKFLDELTPENAEELVSRLVDGDLEITPYQVYQRRYYLNDVELLLKNMSKDLRVELDDQEYYEDEEYHWNGCMEVMQEQRYEQCYKEAVEERLKKYNESVEKGEFVKLNI